ncbi:MAG TPA: hypothetical protein VFG99_11415, partial [Chloroflexia bacterium]|nr:hypothetical protein [Chloroflexia bacterium]
VKIRKPPDFTETLPLSKAGRRLVNLYAVASTNKQGAAAIAPWWVRPARPILFLELGTNEEADLPYSLISVPLPEKLHDLKLSHGNVDYADDSFPLWFLNVGPKANLTDARALRFYLLRLHAEHECLRLVLKLIGDKKVVPGPRDSDTSSALQYYFARTLRHIGRLESKEKDYDPEVAQVARQSIETVSPELAAKITETLEEMDMRYQVLKGIKAYTEQWSQESGPGPTPANTIVIQNNGELTFGGEYNFDGPVQAGAIGDRAEAKDNVLTRVENQPTTGKQ